MRQAPNFLWPLEPQVNAVVHVICEMGTAMKRKPHEASRVTKGQELEVEHLVEVTDIDPKQARTLLRRHGADWPKLKDEAEALKKED